MTLQNFTKMIIKFFVYIIKQSITAISTADNFYCRETCMTVFFKSSTHVEKIWSVGPGATGALKFKNKYVS